MSSECNRDKPLRQQSVKCSTSNGKRKKGKGGRWDGKEKGGAHIMCSMFHLRIQSGDA